MIRKRFGPTSKFLLDFLAGRAFLREHNSLENHLHPACFTCAVFFLTVLAEVAPFPITACVGKVVVVTHCWGALVALVFEAWQGGWRYFRLCFGLLWSSLVRADAGLHA